MLKYIQNFLPYSMEIQAKIIVKYGFTQDNAGKYLKFIKYERSL
jgi:hypothetical protein